MTTRLLWCTDIHWDHADAAARRAFLDAARACKPDALLVTGDIAEAKTFSAALREIRSALDVYIWFVLGNHDHYGASVETARALASILGFNLIHYVTNVDVTPFAGFDLVGVDGWADLRVGRGIHSRVQIADEMAISDLRLRPIDEVAKIRQRLADEDAERLRAQLAKTTQPLVVVATHVPPFARSAWHQGRPSDAEWSPWFVCEATGKALLEAAKVQSERKILVLCGHSHSSGVYDPLPNLRVVTGAAEYGSPGCVGMVGELVETWTKEAP